MWDFGTVRLVGERGNVVHRPGLLNAMDESATNARSTRTQESGDDYGERRREASPTKLVHDSRDTLKAGSGATGTSRQTSPQRKPVAGSSAQRGSPTKVPLPVSPEKSLQRGPGTPRATLTKPPMPPAHGLSHSPDYDRVLQEQLQRYGRDEPRDRQYRASRSNNAVPYQDRPSSKMGQMKIPEIPPYRGPSQQQQQAPLQRITNQDHPQNGLQTRASQQQSLYQNQQPRDQLEAHQQQTPPLPPHRSLRVENAIPDVQGGTAADSRNPVYFTSSLASEPGSGSSAAPGPPCLSRRPRPRIPTATLMR